MAVAGGGGKPAAVRQPGLHLPHTDPDARDLVLSCGATLNHCAVAVAALGWQSKIHRLPHPADPDHLAAIELHRYPATEVDVALAAAIPRRRTDRRHYSSWPVPHGEGALMAARAARAGVMLRRVGELANLKRLMAEAAWRHGTDYDYMTELTTWSGRYGSRSGVPARSTPESDSVAATPARSFTGAVLTQTPDTDPADDHAAVVGSPVCPGEGVCEAACGFGDHPVEQAVDLVAGQRGEPGAGRRETCAGKIRPTVRLKSFRTPLSRSWLARWPDGRVPPSPCRRTPLRQASVQRCRPENGHHPEPEHG